MAGELKRCARLRKSRRNGGSRGGAGRRSQLPMPVAPWVPEPSRLKAGTLRDDDGWGPSLFFVIPEGARERPAPGSTRRSAAQAATANPDTRSEEHTSELQSLMRIPYAVLRSKKKTNQSYTRKENNITTHQDRNHIPQI